MHIFSIKNVSFLFFFAKTMLFISLFFNIQQQMIHKLTQKLLICFLTKCIFCLNSYIKQVLFFTIFFVLKFLNCIMWIYIWKWTIFVVNSDMVNNYCLMHHNTRKSLCVSMCVYLRECSHFKGNTFIYKILYEYTPRDFWKFPEKIFSKINLIFFK